jgi:molecular chaperone GrpE (heat shock protein)
MSDTYEQQLNQIKELQSKNQKISEGAIRVNAQIENSQENYSKVVEIATKFNTHDIEALKQLSIKWAEDNARRIEAAQLISDQKTAEVEEKTRMIKQIQQG